MARKRRSDALRKEHWRLKSKIIYLARWAEAGAPRFMSTDHLTEKYLAICKKWEQIGSILVAKREQFAPTFHSNTVFYS